MTLEQFCKKAGVETFDCGPGWGGRIGLTVKGSQSSVCGFRTKDAAYRHFVKDNCGDLAKSVFSLLKETQKKSAGENP